MLGVNLVEVVDDEAVLLDFADGGQVGVVRVLVPVGHADLPGLVPLPYGAPGHKSTIAGHNWQQPGNLGAIR